MKKNILVKELLFLVLSVVILSSCDTYKHSYRQSNIPDQKVKVADKIGVELVMDDKKIITATSSHRHGSEKAAKDEAYFMAITQNDIHVLVDPIYKVTTSSKILIFGGKSTAEVTGFAGYYRNPRSFQQIQDELNTEKLAREDAELKNALANMQRLKNEGVIAQNAVESSSTQVYGKNNILIKKTTQETSLVDEYISFVQGVKDPSSVDIKSLEFGRENEAKEDETSPISVKTGGLIGKISGKIKNLFNKKQE